MNIAELQLQLHRRIDSIKDEEKLLAIYTLLKDQRGPYEPMSIEQYVRELDEARQQIKDKNYLNVDDFENQSENW